MIFYSALGCIGVITTTFAVSSQLRLNSFAPWSGLASFREETFRVKGGEGGLGSFFEQRLVTEPIFNSNNTIKNINLRSSWRTTLLQHFGVTPRVSPAFYYLVFQAYGRQSPQSSLRKYCPARNLVRLLVGSHFTLHKDQPRGLLDCEKRLIFLLSHSRSRLRVRGERRSRRKRGRKPERWA